MSIQSITLLILLCLSAFFSGSETSLLSLSKIRVRRLKIDKVKNSDTVESLLEKPAELLITILIGNMFVNIFASSIAASVSLKIWGEKGIGISIAVMTIVIVIFCEIMPKIIAIKNAKELSVVVAPFIRAFSQLVFPMRKILGRFSEKMISSFEGSMKKTESDISRDELGSAIKAGYSKGGILDKEEAEMIEDILGLSDKRVEDVMVREKETISFPVTMPLEEMYIAIKEAELSRIPIYERQRKNILGILYAKDLLKKRLQEPLDRDIRALLREPFYVTSDMRLSLLLKEFRARKIHMALVKNGENSLIGLVTLEDLLEEIIGDIGDKETLVQRIRKRYGFLNLSEQSKP